MPVQILQVVGCQDENVTVPRHIGEKYDLLSVTGLQQALHGLELVPSLGILFRGKMVRTFLQNGRDEEKVKR